MYNWLQAGGSLRFCRALLRIIGTGVPIIREVTEGVCCGWLVVGIRYFVCGVSLLGGSRACRRGGGFRRVVGLGRGGRRRYARLGRFVRLVG
ncbi:MAG: hypothetical protein RI897_1458 [Verrucomicrobiota bacterium]